MLRNRCLVREGKIWPFAGLYKHWYNWLRANPSAEDLVLELRCQAERVKPEDQGAEIYEYMVTLEALVNDGWVEASYDPNQRLIGKISFKNFQWHGESAPGVIPKAAAAQ